MDNKSVLESITHLVSVKNIGTKGATGFKHQEIYSVQKGSKPILRWLAGDFEESASGGAQIPKWVE